MFDNKQKQKHKTKNNKFSRKQKQNHKTKKNNEFKTTKDTQNKKVKTTKHIRQIKQIKKYIPEWMSDKGITKQIYTHKKYNTYKSILEPLLLWNEIEKEIINNYTQPKKYINNLHKLNDLRELDDLVHKQTKNYNKMSKEDLIDTLKFLFNNFKEFLFFSIRNNKIKSYYIYNKESTNTWGHELRFIEENGQMNPDFLDYYEKYMKNTGKYHPDNPVLQKNKWYANNCILMTNDWKELPTSYVAQICNMLEEVVTNFDVPDCDMIINRKDFPILNLDKTPAHNNLFSKNKIMETQPDNPWIICSQNKTKNNYDICIPNADEWDFINKLEANKSQIKVNHNWKSKKETAIFRGGPTGCSTNININPRLKLSKISEDWKKVNNKKEYIDVGIVVKNNKLTTKMKVNEQHVTYLSKSPIKLSGRMEYDEQSNYKYIFYILGNASAYRLSNMFYMKSAVIYIDTKYYQWFEPLLIDNKHIIKIKEDFDEKTVYQTMKKLKNNDKNANDIAINGYNFFEKYINKNMIMKYWIKLLIKFNDLQT